MKDSVYPVYRFLKQRADIDPNADLLSTLIESGRTIDAVVLETGKPEHQQQLLDFSGLSYYILNIREKTVLLYPNEEREKYLGIQDDLRFGNSIAYTGFTWAEALSMRDYLDASGTDYRMHMESGSGMGFLLPETGKATMEKILNRLKMEVETDTGERFLTVRNQCWANAISQAARAASSDIAFLGSDGGQNGILINKKGAYVLSTNGTEFIPRETKRFLPQLTSAVLELSADQTSPVKAFFGEDAEIISRGIPVPGAKAISRKDALQTLGLTRSPGPVKLSEMAETDLPEKQKNAVYTLIRMDLCRMMHADGIEKLKPEERKAYQDMHNRYMTELIQETGKFKKTIPFRTEREGRSQ